MYQFVYWKKVVDTYDIGSIRKYARTFRVFLIQLTQVWVSFFVYPTSTCQAWKSYKDYPTKKGWYLW